MPIISDTQTTAVKAAAIAEFVARELKFQAKLLPTVTDVSVYAKKGDKSVSFPKASSFTVQERASGVAGTSDVITYSVETLNLNVRAHVQWEIEDMDAYQATPDIKADVLKRAVLSHARHIDSKILGLLDTNSGHQIAGALTSSKITEAIQFLDQNFAMDQERFLILPALGRKQMLDIADFVKADAFGNSNIPNGIIGSVFGTNVIVHPGATKAFMVQKEAIAFALQKGPQYDEQKNITFGAGSYLAVLDQMYGFLAQRLGEGKAIDNTTALVGTSPFIVEFALT
jgi:Phage capsid protein